MAGARGLRNGRSRMVTVRTEEAQRKYLLNKKSQMIKRLNELLKELETEQTVDPVETLLVVKELSKSCFQKVKYAGCGDLVTRFEEMKPLFDKAPKLKRIDVQSTPADSHRVQLSKTDVSYEDAQDSSISETGVFLPAHINAVQLLNSLSAVSTNMPLKEVSSGGCITTAAIPENLSQSTTSGPVLKGQPNGKDTAGMRDSDERPDFFVGQYLLVESATEQQKIVSHVVQVFQKDPLSVNFLDVISKGVWSRPKKQNIEPMDESQVLEEVCKKQGFIPVEDYKLIHGRKDLDLSLSFRYANLPNNAKLELLKLEKSREEESVLIALQLETGERLQHSFPPGTPLWDILKHWENQASDRQDMLTAVDTSQTPPVHPVCIYMREEVIGECALQRMTLRKLALTGGKAVIRLVHRPVEDSVIAEIMNKVEKDMVKEERLGVIAAKKHAEMQESSPTESLAGVTSVGDSSQTRTLSSSKTSSKSEKSQDNRQETNMEAESCEPVVSRTDVCEDMDVDKSDGGTTSSVVAAGSSSASAMSEARLRNQPPARASSQSGIEQLRSLNIPGVEIFTPEDFNDLPPDQQQIARSLAQRMMRHLLNDPANQLPASHKPVRPRQMPQEPQFSEFKFPEATRGQNLYSNELSDVNRGEYQPCDREAVVFSLEQSSASGQTGNTEDIPDDFFDITEADLRKMMTDLQKNVENLSETPLMTKAMRQAKLEERYSGYKKVVIRIQFPDKLVLQGLFRPRETVFAVQKFVKENLQDKSIPYYLYTTPPKCILKDKTMTLIEAELVPATRVYFGSDEKKDHYLSDAVMAEVSPREEAERIAFQSLPSAEAEIDLEPSSDSQRSKSKSSSSGSTSSQSGGKVPKWLKLGKK